MLTLKIHEISQMPASFILSRDFHYANIVWVRMWNGHEYELLFDESGCPLTDQALISRIANYFSKRFQPMMINDELIYGQKIGNSINHHN